MDQRELRELIVAVVRESAVDPVGETRYRSPIVGFSPVDLEEFARLKETVPEHLLPDEVLPGARGLVSYFLPFSEDVVRANTRSRYVAREWAVAYVETNRLLSTIAQQLVDVLAAQGIRAVAELPTYVFDRKTLRARWSHKSIAYMTGIGSFGLHRMLITDAGCAGRFGSIVLDSDISTPAGPRHERCLYFHNGTCASCVGRCPVAALRTDGSFYRGRCYESLLEVDAYFSDLPLTDVCGKCAVALPCSMTDPAARKDGLAEGLSRT